MAEKSELNPRPPAALERRESRRASTRGTKGIKVLQNRVYEELQLRKQEQKKKQEEEQSLDQINKIFEQDSNNNNNSSSKQNDISSKQNDDDENTKGKNVPVVDSKNPERKAKQSMSNWGMIRKEVVPTSELAKVSAKIQSIITILKTPPEDRTENVHVTQLHQWLMNQEKIASLFTTMSEGSAKKLCKELEFLHLKAGEVVVNQGDKGNTCFILVGGLVSVYVRNPEEQKKYLRIVGSLIESECLSRLREMNINYGTHVATLKPGATFGELCLIEPDSKRSATVIVDNQVDSANFIVLTAASYMRMTRNQTIEGIITEHMAFLQTMLLFHDWTKMELIHLVNSMKLINVTAKGFLAHKGSEAESFYIIIRGEAEESIKLTLNESNESVGENRSVQHAITVPLTYLGRFDVAGEYLASDKKIVVCPVDIRAVTDVDALMLNKKLFHSHFLAKDVKKNGRKALKMLRRIAEAREAWRETRINQATLYPNLRVPITRKLMRLSRNVCVICGRNNHIAGDELCLESASYNMEDERKKKKEAKARSRAQSSHRISVDPKLITGGGDVSGGGQGGTGGTTLIMSANLSRNPESIHASDRKSAHLQKQLEKSLAPIQQSVKKEDDRVRLGQQLVLKKWSDVMKSINHLERPKMIPPVIASATSSRSTRQFQEKRNIQEEIQVIRSSWPYHWHDANASKSAR